jgi:hypothetical protein
MDQEHADYEVREMPPSKAAGLVSILAMIGPWIGAIGAVVAVMIVASRLHP